MGKTFGYFVLIPVLLCIVGAFIISPNYVVANSYGNALNKNELKVMTFNIRGGRNGERQVQLETLINEIRLHDPDVIGLQEVDIGLPRSGFTNEIDYIGQQLHMNYVFIPHLNFGVSAYGDAILSKLPIQSSRGYRLPSGIEPRGIVEATIEHQKQKISVYSTHFGLGEQERTQQFKALREIVKQDSGAKIILADLNTKPNEEKLRTFMNMAGTGFNQEQASLITIPSQHTQMDYVLYSDKFKQLRMYVGKSNVSDHNPLISTLTLK